MADALKMVLPTLATSGYIFVAQDIRGRYASGGKFVMNRPIVAHTTKNDVDETTDTNDTVEWLLKNVPNHSAKVGVMGVSYPGFLAMMAGIDANPAVKAISPQAPMTNIWIGDDFFHNGAFRETYGFDYVAGVGGAEDQRVHRLEGRPVQLLFGAWEFCRSGKGGGDDGPADGEGFPDGAGSYATKFWQDMAVETHLKRPEVPTLEVGGYWDQEDMWGPQAEYAALRAHEKPNEPLHKVWMVLGPWNHGGWGGGPGDKLGGKFGTITFGGAADRLRTLREHYEAPFFEMYLKGKPGFDLEDTASFRTGENQWHTYAIWPPKVGYHQERLYLEADHKLGFVGPKGDYDVKAAA